MHLTVPSLKSGQVAISCPVTFFQTSFSLLYSERFKASGTNVRYSRPALLRFTGVRGVHSGPESVLESGPCMLSLLVLALRLLSSLAASCSARFFEAKNANTHDTRIPNIAVCCLNLAQVVWSTSACPIACLACLARLDRRLFSAKDDSIEEAMRLSTG